MVRQLTAMMFTDMAGFTALMQRDEHRARESMERQRGVLEREVVAHGGKVLQLYGDGSLSIFRSAIDAVRCAIAIQLALRESPPVPLRIGIHSGDVVHDNEGVFGDGVNVASRIQALAAPGGVLISGKVYDEVKNHPDILTRSLGAFGLKHVKHPMKVFAITNDQLAVPEESDIATGRVGQTKSVAVLPFVNMSTDPENEFFSDGVTEEIINALTRVNGLKVTARTSSFAFKNQNEDIRAIAERLAVSHILEGSVRRVGSRVRVTAQLICATDGYHLFSETYDRSIEDIFTVQDEIARTIVSRLVGHLGPVRTSAEERVVRGSHSHDTEAYAEYLRGRFEWARFTPDSARRSIRHYERSVEMDPTCALPYAGMAAAYSFLGTVGYLSATEAFPLAEEAARKALQLEPDAGQSYVSLAVVKLFYDWDFDEAYHLLQKALSLTPGFAEAHYIYGLYLSVIEDHDEAIEVTRTAVHLDPLSPVYNDSLAYMLSGAGRLDEARDQIDRTLETHPHFRSAIQTSGWVHFLQGDHDAAIAEFERLPVEAGHEFAGAADRGHAYGRAGRLEDAQRMLGLVEARQKERPDMNLDIDFALIYEGLGERDRALACLQRAIERRLGSVVLMGGFSAFREARLDPRFEELLERIGIPRVVAV